jgi:hypothetical protein
MAVITAGNSVCFAYNMELTDICSDICKFQTTAVYTEILDTYLLLEQQPYKIQKHIL